MLRTSAVTHGGAPLPGRIRTRSFALETLELHVLRDGSSPPIDVVLSRTTPRLGHGRPYLDVGVLVAGKELVARSAREQSDVRLPLPEGDGRWQARFAGVEVDLELTPIAQRAGVSIYRATGTIVALEQRFELTDRVMFAYERKKARRPYAWARATLYGIVDGAPLACIVETGRRRAGSVVLPELGRILFIGPGKKSLPRDCVVAPLPVRAEYGTGRLKSTALAPSHRLIVELAAPPEETALFEMVDPDGEAAYAHRAGDAKATLTIVKRKVEIEKIELEGRFEWGARAGDPRVENKAWRAS